MWYSVNIKPEDRINTRNGKALLIVYKTAFAAHVLYNVGTSTVTNHGLDLHDVPLDKFESWCLAPAFRPKEKKQA